MQKRRTAVATALAVGVLTMAACGSGGSSGHDAKIQPLTGLPVSKSKAENSRPALYVKIENSPNARPQTGLDSADVVYEAVAEGGITRFAAIFHGTDPGDFGPIRSIRAQDAALAAPLKPVAVFAGGLPPYVDAIRSVAQDESTSSPLGESPPYRRTSDRRAPHNLYGNADGFWNLAKSPYDEPPQPLFEYGDLPAGAQPAQSATVDFSPAAKVTWTWDGTAWRRAQNGTPFTVTGSGRIGPADVLIQFVEVHDSDARDPAGNPVPESTVTGGGEAWLLRDGKVIKGTWAKGDDGDVTSFTTDGGDTMKLKPGRTWVELVPQGRPVSVG